MGAGIRKKAALNGIIEEQGRTILDGEVVDDESFVLVIVEQVRDPKLPELGVGEQANDVADVVAPESPGISETNRLKRSEEAAGCTGIPKDLQHSNAIASLEPRGLNVKFCHKSDWMELKRH